MVRGGTRRAMTSSHASTDSEMPSYSASARRAAPRCTDLRAAGPRRRAPSASMSVAPARRERSPWQVLRASRRRAGQHRQAARWTRRSPADMAPSLRGRAGCAAASSGLEGDHSVGASPGRSTIEATPSDPKRTTVVDRRRRAGTCRGSRTPWRRIPRSSAACGQQVGGEDGPLAAHAAEQHRGRPCSWEPSLTRSDDDCACS